jgi:cell wall-associated NlpC family hydrolase
VIIGIRWRCLIRTKYQGVLGIAVIVFMVIAGVMGFTESVSAHASSTTKTTQSTVAKKKVVKSSTTKGVRTKTAYQKRRTQAKYVKAKPKPKAKKAYVTPVKKQVAIPAEVAASSSSADIAQKAKGLVGSRYKYGGMSPKTGFDCSGLVHYVYGNQAKKLPRSAAAMYGSVAKTNSLRPGDIVFFGRGRVHHAAVYVGDGKVVHASTPGSGVRYDNLSTLSRALGLAGIGRV